MLRVAFLFIFLPVAPAWAQDAPRVVAFAGIEWTRFADAQPLAEDGQTTTAFARDDSGLDLTLGAEVALLRWLGVGVAHERLSSLQLDQTFDVDDFRGFSNRLRRRLDPAVTELYAAPSWPLGARVRATGMVGIGVWRADEDNDLVLSFEGAELSRRQLAREHSGATLVVGAGVDVRLHRRLGVRVGYKYLSLSDDGFDHPLHNLRALLLVGFGG